MNNIERFFRTEYAWYVAIFKRRMKLRRMRKQAFALKEAKMIADQKTLSKGIKHWVVNDRGNFLIIDRSDILRLKKAGRLDKKAASGDFDREAVYTTQIVTHRQIEKGSDYKPVKPKINPMRKFFKLVLGW